MSDVEITSTTMAGQVRELLRAKRHQALSVAEMAQALQIPPEKMDSFRAGLIQLFRAGDLIRPSRGYYRLAPRRSRS